MGIEAGVGGRMDICKHACMLCVDLFFRVIAMESWGI